MDNPKAPKATGRENASCENEQQKTWFEYIKTLNERRLQSALRSGLTTYLLLVAIAGLIYRFVPLLPSFWKVQGSGRAVTVFFLLEIDILSFVGVALFGVSTYCGEGIEYRIFPEHRRRVNRIGIVFVIGLMTAFAGAHIQAVWRFGPGSHWVRSGLAVLSLYWILNAATVIWQEARKIKKSLANKVPILSFSAMQTEPTLRSASFFGAVFGLLVLVSGATLILYAKSFSSDWTQPWKAASVSVVFLVLFLSLLNRWALSIGEKNYLELERDILLKNLSVDEIRATFVKQLVGLDASQWLEDLLNQLKASSEELAKSNESGKKQLQEIQEIDAGYLTERLSRTEKLVRLLDEQLDKHRLEFEQFRFRLDLFCETYLGPKERQALARWRAEFATIADDTVRTSKDGHNLLSETRAFLKNLKETH